MKNAGKSIRIKAGSQKGFTLVELLVVVAILGILSAVAMPSMSGLSAGANRNAALTELSTIQMAMDAYIAHNSLSSITASGVGINDMSTYKPDGTTALYPNYMRSQFTKYHYTIDSNPIIGTVHQTDTPPP